MDQAFAGFRERLGQELYRHAASVQSTPEVRSAAPRKRRRLVYVAAAAVTLLVIAVVGSASHRATAPAAAAETLRAAARRIAASETLPAHAYRYLRWRELSPTAPGGHMTVEQWIRADGAGFMVTRRSGAAKGIPPVERVRLHSSKEPFELVGQRFSRDNLRACADSQSCFSTLLSKATRRLFLEPARRQFSVAERRGFAAYIALSELVFGPPAPPVVQQRLYDQIAKVPGIAVRTRTAMATTVGARVGDVAFAITLDSQTGQVRKVERRLLRRSAQIPGRPRIVSEAVIERVGARVHLPKPG